MWRRVAWLGLMAPLVAIASFVACRQLVGITDNPPEDLVTSICGLPYGTNTCASCVNTSCCAESTTCAADPGCAAYQSCLGKCIGEPGCRSQCIGDNPVGTSSDVSALSACLVSNCETACGLTCGSIAASIAPPDAGASCETCLESKGASCDKARACGSSVDCQAYAQCLHAYTTPDWRQACATEHDAGAALYAPLDSVASAGCATDCAYGQDWRCVGHVAWPPPMASVTTIIIEEVHDGVTSLPIVGAEYSVCSPGAATGVPPCAPSLFSGQTSDSGFIELEVPTVQANSTTLTGWDGWTLVSAAGYLPGYYYSFFPLSQAQLTFAPNSSAFLFTASEVASVYAQGDAGIQVSGTGSGLAFVYDCQVHFAPEVRVSANDPSVVGGGSAEGGVTNAGGGWFFGDVPVGNLTLTATPLGLGKPIGQFSFYVSASAYTVPVLFPQP